MKPLRLILTAAFLVWAANVLAEKNLDPVLAAGGPAVALNVENATPRKVEDTTRMAMARDYSAAWATMAEALEQNRPELLGANFIGDAKATLTDTIDAQRRSNLHQHFIDKGHNVEVVFYSPEGSAIELHDTAQLELQLLDGSKLVHSEDTTVHYVVLLTAAENSWNVRLLQAVPGF
jgi:hypothetical protein